MCVKNQRWANLYKPAAYEAVTSRTKMKETSRNLASIAIANFSAASETAYYHIFILRQNIARKPHNYERL